MRKEEIQVCFKGESMFFEKKFELTVFTFIMVFIMSGVISIVLSLIRFELDIFMIMHWFESWILAFLIAFPTARFAIPLIKKYLWILVKS